MTHGSQPPRVVDAKDLYNFALSHSTVSPSVTFLVSLSLSLSIRPLLLALINRLQSRNGLGVLLGSSLEVPLLGLVQILVHTNTHLAKVA